MSPMSPMSPMGLAFLHRSAARPVSPSVPTALQAQTPPRDRAAPLWVIPLGHGRVMRLQSQ